MTRDERKRKEMKECAAGIWVCTLFFTLLGFFILDGVRLAGWLPIWFNTSFVVAANIAMFGASLLLVLYWAEKSVYKQLDREDAENGQSSPQG